jgi:nucleoside-diphosphate-sugar epimerase
VKGGKLKLAVTGGAGFLGFHLCNQLREKYDEILVLDIAPIDQEEYPANVRYFRADVRNREKLDEIFRDADAVVHAAAALPLWKKRDIFEIDVDGTRNVLKAARKNGIERVVQISSTAVYGVPKKHPIEEDDPLIGVGFYGRAKILAERACDKFRGDMCVPIVRPKTFIGPERLGVFQILYDWVESGKRIPIIGSGKNRYQLLDVSDLVDAVSFMLTEPEEKVNRNFNVGAERFHTVLEDVGALCAYAGNGAGILPTPAFLVKPLLAFFYHIGISPLYKWLYGTADKDSYVSVDRLKEAVGWKPEYSNVDALTRAYQWYLDNKEKVKATGVTHRVAWKQGVLGLFKKML